MDTDVFLNNDSENHAFLCNQLEITCAKFQHSQQDMSHMTSCNRLITTDNLQQGSDVFGWVVFSNCLGADQWHGEDATITGPSRSAEISGDVLTS